MSLTEANMLCSKQTPASPPHLEGCFSAPASWPQRSLSSLLLVKWEEINWAGEFCGLFEGEKALGDLAPKWAPPSFFFSPALIGA